MKQESITSGTTDSNVNRPKQIAKPSNILKVAGKCPITNVHINGVPVTCLIDSSSEVTTMTESHFRQNFNEVPMYECNWINLSAANGLSIPIQGIIVVDIAFQGSTFKDMYVLITKDSTNKQMKMKKEEVPGILGCNVIQHLYQQYSTHTNVNEEFKPIQEQFQQYAIKAQEVQQLQKKLENNETGILGFVKTIGKHLVLPANNSTIIEGTTCKLPETVSVLVEHMESSPHADVMITPTITTVDQHGHLKFEVTNMSSKDIIIERPSKIAKISPFFICKQM